MCRTAPYWSWRRPRSIGLVKWTTRGRILPILILSISPCPSLTERYEDVQRPRGYRHVPHLRHLQYTGCIPSPLYRWYEALYIFRIRSSSMSRRYLWRRSTGPLPSLSSLRSNIRMVSHPIPMQHVDVDRWMDLYFIIHGRCHVGIRSASAGD